MNQSHTSRLRSARLAAILTGAILSGPTVHAQDFTWGNLTGLWSLATNWVEGTAPDNFESDGNLIFGGGGATAYTATNNITPDVNNFVTLHRITLESTATVTNTLNTTGAGLLKFVSNGSGPAAIDQNGTGAFQINMPIVLGDPLSLEGTPTSGLVTFGSSITGTGNLNISGGKWRFAAANSVWSGTTTITDGASVLVQPTALPAGGAVNLSLSGANSQFGTDGTIAINDGTLKLSPIESGSLTLGGNRTLAFGALGGVVDMVNTTGGNIAGGDFAVTTSAGATAPGVIKFNGGANGLMDNSATNGNWNSNGNTLRFRSYSGTGPLRVELSNGAAMRLGTGGTGTVTVATPLTIRGVLGGDPTSQNAQRNSAIAKNTGRVVADNFNTVAYTAGLVFENAVQVHAAGATRALDGNITIAGTASGNPGFVAFSGRGTGTALGPTINAPGASAIGQNVLWLGRDGNDTLTIQDGGIAVLDARMRYDQAVNHGVLLNANAAIAGGGTLRFYQSVSNASGSVTANTEGQTVNTQANVGNHIVQGDLVGTGNSTRDAAVDIYLPVGAPITADVAANTRPYGGVVFEGTSDLIVNGSGYGGLRINGFARANALFANNVPDTVSNSDKVNNLLTTARIGALTGSGGYLTVAPANETYVFPNAEWAPGVTVGLKVVNQNPNGTDLRFDAAKTSWGHNLAIEDGATLDTGTPGLTLSAGTLQGLGNVIGQGGLTIGAGGNIAPGLGGVGTLAVRNLSLNGAYLAQTTSTASDLLRVTGNVALGATSNFTLEAGSTFQGNRITVLSYTGEITGTFGSTTNLPAGATVNYDIPGRVRLVLDTINERVWEGAPGTIWSTNANDKNWEGDLAFANGEQVRFDDTAAGTAPRTVTISGVVSPDLVTFNNTGAYTVNGSATNFIGGDGALVKNGSGSVTLNGTNTYSAGTTIRSGALILGSDNVLPDAGMVTIATGAALNPAGHTDTIGELIVDGTVNTGRVNVSSLILRGTGTIDATLGLGGNALKAGAGTATITGGVDLSAATRTISVDSGATLAISGAISNGGLTKDGAGVLELASANTYTGGTNILAGAVKAKANQAIGNGTLQVAAGATADLNGFDQTTTTLSGAGAVTLGVATLTVSGTGAATFSGIISGEGDIVKGGTNVLTLGGANTFSGGLDIQGGRVNLANAAAAGTSLITVGTGGAIQVGGAHTNMIQFDGGVVSSQSGADVRGIWTIDGNTEFRSYNQDTNGGSDIVFLGALQGEGNINLVASPTAANADNGQGLRLRGLGESTYSGTITANKKTKLEIQVASATGTNPLGDGSIRMIAGTSTGGLNGDYSQLQPRVSKAGDTHVFGSDVEISGPGYVNVNILGEANTVAQFGKLTIGAGQTLGSSKNDKTVRTLEFTSVNLTGGMAEIRAYDPGFGVSTNVDRGGSNIRLGAIGESAPDAGIITKSGDTYAVEIFGDATYTGPTYVDGGTLRVSASGSIESSSEVRIATGAKLDVLAHVDGYEIPAGQLLTGTGDWDGRLLMAGELAPGSGVGTITGDNFTLQGTGIMQFELAANNTSDKLVLTGAFDKGSAGAFQFDFGGAGVEGVFTLVQFASSTFAASDFSYVDLGPGLSATFQMTDTALQLAVVPEPGSAIALLLGGALLGMRRRRRA